MLLAAIVAVLVLASGTAGARLRAEELSTKAPYPSDEQESAEASRMPPTCELVHVAGVFRHGSRYVTRSAKAARLAKRLEEEAAGLSLEGRRLACAAQAFAVAQAPRAGGITERGAEEVRNIGQRLGRRHADAWASAVVERRQVRSDTPSGDWVGF